jgi:hypothetical protein
MFIQIAFGAGLSLANIVISAIAAMLLESVLKRIHPWLVREPHPPKQVLLMAGVSLWVLGVVTAGVWLWALAYRAIGAFVTLEEAVYFSLVSYTTLGFGDVLMPHGWRILAGMEAANGFLNFGLFTALLLDGLRQLRSGQRAYRGERG